MGEIAVTDEPAKIISQPPRGQAYRIDVEGATVALDHNRSALLRQGQRVEPGDRAELSNLRGQPLYARATQSGATAIVNVNEAEFSINFQSRARLAASRENRGAVVSDSTTVGTSPVQLPDNEVADGFEVILQSDPGNNDRISVGNSATQALTLEPGQSVTVGVENTNVVHAVAASAGQTLNIFGEV